MGLAAFVDWTRRPPPSPPCWETDPWREGASVEDIQAYEDEEAARLAVVDGRLDAVPHAVAVEGLYGHERVTSPARSQSFAVVCELAHRHQWKREYRCMPLSAAARDLERRTHLCGLNCYAYGCSISGIPAVQANTTPDAGTSRAEDASAMTR